jgi:hypothetical protein
MVASYGGPKPPTTPHPLDQQQNDNNFVFEGICALLYATLLMECHSVLWSTK